MLSDTVLVTGGAGFIGCNFVRYWLKRESGTVVNLDKLTYAGNMGSLSDLTGNQRHVFVRGDICDQSVVDALLERYRPRAIVHFAAESHVDRSIHGPEDFIQTNVVGTFRLLESARAFWSQLPDGEQSRFRFLHVSTDEVYGTLGPDDPAFAETTAYAPNSPYAASKAGSDHVARAYFHTYGLPVLTTNCSNNYGPFQFPEKLIPLIILNALSGKPLPIYGDGGNVRDWLYVVDHCAAIWRVLQAGKPGEVYNVGGNCELTNLQVVDALCSIIDELFPDAAHVPHKSLKLFVKDRPGHDLRYAIDASKLKRELAWEPQATFETGLKETVLWYLDHLDWCREVAAESYQGERLGTG
jgi:dTDP-glucose 4,6-dehydratase